MRYQEFFLKRFITNCLILVFFFFLNCAITAEAGMVLGEVCFDKNPESERKQDIYTITTKGKILEEPKYIVICTIKQECKDCQQGKIQLIRGNDEKCYKYKFFIYTGKYHIDCDKCRADLTGHEWSLQRDINFCHSDEDCQDKH